MANYRNRALLDLARDQACANCGVQDGTIVAAHSNWSRHGKAKSLKAHDIFHAHLCMACHYWLDQGSGLDPTGRFKATRDEKLEVFLRAMDATMLRLWQSGKIKVAK